MLRSTFKIYLTGGATFNQTLDSAVPIAFGDFIVGVINAGRYFSDGTAYYHERLVDKIEEISLNQTVGE